MTTLVSPDDPHDVERLSAHYAAEDRPDPAAAMEELRLVLADGKRTIRDLRLEIARLRAEREVMCEAEPTADELKALDDSTGPEDAPLRSLRARVALLVEVIGGGR